VAVLAPPDTNREEAQRFGARRARRENILLGAEVDIEDAARAVEKVLGNGRELHTDLSPGPSPTRGGEWSDGADGLVTVL
jgi:hypothetical protein